MALKPEPMQRALIVAAKGHQPAVIEVLHGLRSAHIIDFEESREGEFAEFRIGKPLPASAAASGKLVRVRAMLRQLGLEGAYSERPMAVRDVETRIETALDPVETEVARAIEAREHVRTSLHEGRELEAKLEPFSSLPVKLEDYDGYDTLEVFVGRADLEFRNEIARIAPDHLLVTGEGTLFALFVPKAKATEASDLLYRHGYAEVEVPDVQGNAAEKLREIRNDRANLEARLTKADAEIVRLAKEHKDFLLAAEEHLSIIVEKAEAPLSFASTENAFIVDAWIPMGSVAAVEAAVKKATHDTVYFARLETSDDVAHDELHHHAEHHDGGVDAGFGAHPGASAPKQLPPTKYDNPASTARFQWFTNLFSTPRFNEIDPTSIFAIFFPVFFGFMVGDLGLGLVMVLLGWLLATKLPRVEGMKELGTAILIAGVIASIFGGLVFKDALGIPLGVNDAVEHHVADKLPGVTAFTCADVYKYAHEATWTCIFRGSGADVHHETWSDPLVHKITDVPSMLLLSILAGLVHLTLGLIIGLRNEWGHGKHFAAKIGYLLLLLSFFPAAAALLRGDIFAGYTGPHPHTALAPHIPITANQAFAITGVGVLVSGAVLGWSEGVGGILEIPSMFGAIMSYLRLGAVAIAKGAMAVAFNSFTLVPGLLAGDAVALVIGIIGFLIVQTVLLALGLLSGGIQALRLNFVEFFTKFYKGGGTPYSPFGRERKHTGPAPAASAAVSSVMIKP